MKTVFLLLCLLPVHLTAQVDSGFVKIGYADMDYIYGKLPASKQIDTELKSLQAQLENQLKLKYNEFQQRHQHYLGREKSMTAAELQQAQKDLQTLQDNLQKLEAASQHKFQQKQKDLMAPVTASIQKAIGDIARENHYGFILNAGASSHDVILHADEKVDVSDLILKKMGIDSQKHPPSTVERR